MRRLVGLALICMFVAAVAFAGVGEDQSKMTPEKAMQRMMECSCCAPLMENPAMGEAMRFDINKTKTGFVSTMMISDESMVGELTAAIGKCENTRATAMAEYAKGDKTALCPFCEGISKVMPRDDVAMENFTTKMGAVMIMTASTEAGVKALHEYADMASHTQKMLHEAGMKMKGEKKG